MKNNLMVKEKLNMNSTCKFKFTIPVLVILVLFFSNCVTQNNTENFNQDWRFGKAIDSSEFKELLNGNNNITDSWQLVDIPHSAHIEPLIIKDKQWQGTCYYYKSFEIDKSLKNKCLAIKFDGAMHTAKVFLNGKLIHTNYGGYLPFYIDITGKAYIGKINHLAVELNNEDNPLVPPGKPIDKLDFNYYSGIYRDVKFIVKDKIHISDPIGANRIAGGGVMVYSENVTSGSATVKINIDVENEDDTEKNVQTIAYLYNSKNELIGVDSVSAKKIGIHSNHIFSHAILVKNPELWTTDNPILNQIKVVALTNNAVVDEFIGKIGIRSISFSAENGFVLNGNHLKIRGTNRHQDYPYIGYALSNQANYRDAYKIKQAGFNFVRLSHYPHSTSFLEACDELGIMVMDAIPGWQFFGNEKFQENSFNDIRKMVRRDRNHPSVILWEASLNESGMSNDYMQKAHQIVHNELPGQQVYTCGWRDMVYDVFIPARQHAKPPYYWNKYDKQKPLLLAEYGDWEYYAQNAGFNQSAYADLSEEERNSRQLREYGQKRLVQQALNYQEAHNSNLQGPAVGDANWLMFDYNRGYAPDIESSGISDIFRLPKFAFYFYQSQAGPNLSEGAVFGKPMVFIANYWNDPEFNTVKVYSNCDEVELLLNGTVISRQKPDIDRYSTNIQHPPFTFEKVPYSKGELKAVAYINGKLVTEHIVKTPGKAVKLKLEIDTSGKEFTAGCNDVVFVYAFIIDKDGTVVPENGNKINLSIEGDAEIIGSNELGTEAGISGFVLKGGREKGNIKISAVAENMEGAVLNTTLQ